MDEHDPPDHQRPPISDGLEAVEITAVALGCAADRLPPNAGRVAVGAGSRLSQLQEGVLWWNDGRNFGTNAMWPSNALTERLNLKWPILQAPMGSASTPALAAAVSNAGGLGGLGMWGRTAEQAGRRIAGVPQTERRGPKRYLSDWPRSALRARDPRGDAAASPGALQTPRPRPGARAA